LGSLQGGKQASTHGLGWHQCLSVAAGCVSVYLLCKRLGLCFRLVQCSLRAQNV
jgi:hypothetical protein